MPERRHQGGLQFIKIREAFVALEVRLLVEGVYKLSQRVQRVEGRAG